MEKTVPRLAPGCDCPLSPGSFTALDSLPSLLIQGSLPRTSGPTMPHRRERWRDSLLPSHC